MAGYLIAETTREEREKIVAESLGNIEANCDGCMAGLADDDMAANNIDGKERKLREINMEFSRKIRKRRGHASEKPVSGVLLLIEIKEGTKLKYELRQYEATE